MTILAKVLIPSVLCSMALLGCQKSVEQTDASAVTTTPAQETSATTTPATTNDATSSMSTTYTCDQGKTVIASYDNTQPDQPKATLSIDGKTYQLHQAVSASGARYTTEQGLNPDQGLSWHTKGKDAIASTITLDHTAKPEDEKVLLSCTEKSA